MGLVGMDDAAGNAVWHVLVRVPPGAEVEWYEDAADAAEGNLAEALQLQRLADAGWRGTARVLVAKSVKHSRNSSGAGKKSSETRRANSAARTMRLDPLLSLAHKMLADKGRKVIGWSALKTASRKIAKTPGNEEFLPLLDELTEAHIENWRLAKGT
jgi:hypothetical protein